MLSRRTLIVNLRRTTAPSVLVAVQPGLTDVIDGDVSFAKSVRRMKYQQPLGS